MRALRGVKGELFNFATVPKLKYTRDRHVVPLFALGPLCEPVALPAFGALARPELAFLAYVFTTALVSDIALGALPYWGPRLSWIQPEAGAMEATSGSQQGHACHSAPEQHPNWTCGVTLSACHPVHMHTTHETFVRSKSDTVITV